MKGLAVVVLDENTAAGPLLVRKRPLAIRQCWCRTGDQSHSPFETWNCGFGVRAWEEFPGLWLGALDDCDLPGVAAAAEEMVATVTFQPCHSGAFGELEFLDRPA